MRQRRLSRPMRWAGFAAVLAAVAATVMVAGYSRGLLGEATTPPRGEVPRRRRPTGRPLPEADGRRAGRELEEDGHRVRAGEYHDRHQGSRCRGAGRRPC